MALGSIEHLQHYFTKTGLIAKKEYVTVLYLSRLPHNQNPGSKPKGRALSLQLDPSTPTPKGIPH